MPLTSNRLLSTLDKKQHYQEVQGRLTAQNIAFSSQNNEKRQELKAFKTLLNNNNEHVSRDFKVTQRDLINTREEIHRDKEMFDLAKSSIDHDSILQIIKAYHRMLRTSTARI